MARIYSLVIAILAFSATSLGAQEFTFVVADTTVGFDAAGEASFQVTVQGFETDIGAGFPTGMDGFSFSLGNDPDLLVPEYLTLSDDIADLNGGAGPSFLALLYADSGDGVSVGVIYDCGSGVTMEWEEPTDLIHIDYSTVAATLIGGPAVTTTLEFDSSVIVHGATVDNIVVFDYGAVAVEPLLDDATVTLEPPAASFLRGDANGNGSVAAVTDALYLLDWSFGGGPAPECLDAADFDDSGDVNSLIDALLLLVWTFASGAESPAPGPLVCGPDPTDDGLDCATAMPGC